MSKIHNTAIISKNVIIDAEVEIGAYSVIGENVKIGKGTKIKSHVIIEGDTTIGEGNIIYSFAAIGTDPQDLKYAGEDTKVIIGNNNKIREYVTINKGTIASGKTIVGNDNLLMAYSHIAHDCIVGSHCILANAATLGGHAEIDDWAIIGGLTGIHQFVKIGAHVMVGGGSALKQDVMPYVIVDGNDAKVRGINSIGLQRRGFTKEELQNIKKAYKIIFRSKLKMDDALEKLKDEFAEDEKVKLFIEFAEKSERGVYR